MEQVMTHPARMMYIEITLAALFEATPENVTAMDLPSLHVSAPLSSATLEDHYALALDHLDLEI